MPSDLRSRAQHEIDDAVRDVGEQGDYLGEEATSLRRRAEWTEKADRGGWTSLLDLFDLFGLGGVPALSDRFGKPSRPDLDQVFVTTRSPTTRRRSGRRPGRSACSPTRES